jgi:RNA polymerase-interacting CarD/CdnL/TRCF family regulator
MTQQLEVGQRIVHRRYGAGTVVRVRKGRKDEEFERYYVLDIPSRDLKVHLPVNSEQQMDLRKLASKAKIGRACSLLSEQPADLPKDYRERRALISEALEEGTVIALAQVIRDLVGLKNRKSLSTLESTWLTNAKRRLAGELALVTGVDLNQAVQRIERALVRDEMDQS